MGHKKRANTNIDQWTIITNHSLGQHHYQQGRKDNRYVTPANRQIFTLLKMTELILSISFLKGNFFCQMLIAVALIVQEFSTLSNTCFIIIKPMIITDCSYRYVPFNFLPPLLPKPSFSFLGPFAFYSDISFITNYLPLNVLLEDKSDIWVNLLKPLPEVAKEKRGVLWSIFNWFFTSLS